MIVRGIFILLLAVLGAGYLNMGLSSASGPGPDAMQNQAAAADAKAVLTHSIEAFIARDLDALMSDYTEGSIVITPDGVVTGLDNIRALYSDAFKDGDQSEAPFEVTKVHSAGAVAYILWQWTMKDGSVLDGTDTLIVDHGKISQQSVAYFPQNMPEAEGAGEPEADADADVMDAPEG